MIDLRLGGLAVALGLGAAALWGSGSAAAAPDATAPDPQNVSRASRSHAQQHVSPTRQIKRRAAATGRSTVTADASTVGPGVSVRLPQLPVTTGASFTISTDAIAAVASDYIASGGDASDSARFFFGDLAVASLQALAGPDIAPDQVRTQLGNLAVSGYFGGIWLRDNLRDNPTAAPAPSADPPAVDLTVSAIGIRLFDTLAAGLTGAAATANPWIVTTVAHASVPVLLALYGYNRGYLDVILQNPPAGVPSMQNSLSCRGFLDCSSSAFPLQIATAYDTALTNLAEPPNLAWLGMAAWATLLESATGAGRFVWEAIARAGAFSPNSYAALVELSSDYLMVSKAAVLSSMIGAADGNAGIAAAALRLQAGLWMWSGAYFAGLASNAPAGTLPTIVTA
ncbi:MAG: hypothetical protein ACR2JI_13235 [Mycobacterium sp.]